MQKPGSDAGLFVRGNGMDQLDAATIARINAEHFVHTELRACDLLFVFGTREDADKRAVAAVDLWKQGFCKWVIVSGGMTPGADRTECTVITDMMVREGMPEQIVLEEHHAMNTGENVIFSLPIIDAAIGLAAIESVICLGNSWTARRYPMTLHSHWPQVDKILVTVNPFETPEARWHEDPTFRALVLKENAKIAPYLARGFIAHWPLERLSQDR